MMLLSAWTGLVGVVKWGLVSAPTRSSAVASMDTAARQMISVELGAKEALANHNKVSRSKTKGVKRGMDQRANNSYSRSSLPSCAVDPAKVLRDT